MPTNGSRGNENATAVFDVPTPSASPASAAFPLAPSASLGSSQPIPSKDLRSRPPRGRRSRLFSVAGVVLTLLVIAGGGVLIWRGVTQQNSSVSSAQSANATQRFNTLSIPLNEIAKAGFALNASRTLSINGQLNVNNSFVLAPTAQPTNSVAGQMYYDKTTNELNYYNGTGFVALTGNPQMVTSLGGTSGVLTLGGGLSIANNQLRNNGVVNIASASTNLTVLNDGNGNITLGSTLSTPSTNGVQSQNGGTAGSVPIFDGTRSLADSIMSQSGSAMAINGGLSVAGTLNLQTDGVPSINLTDTVSGVTGQVFNDGNLHITGGQNNLWLDAGGSGTLFLNAGNTNPVAVNESTIPLYAFEVNGDVNLTAGHSYRINGTIICTIAGCSGGGGGSVSSLNGLTGALNVANATAAGSTITINDASTAQKGIAQFNATNFSAASGIVNTIQNIDVTATPTFGTLTLTSSQATSPMLLVNNTNLGASGNLIDLQANSVSRISVSPAGNMTLTGTVNGQVISSTASFNGTLGVSGLASLNGGATVTGTLTANTITPTSAMTVGAIGQSLTLQGNASTSLTATSGASTTTLSFQTPTANVNYRLLTAVAGTYDICTSIGNCAGTGGGVTTVGGTSGTIARFSGTDSIVDSIITDNGSTVTIGGALAVNTISPTGAMTIGSTGQSMLVQGTTTTISSTNAGVTNSLVFNTPGTSNKTITVPNATGTIVVSASAPLSIDSAGNLTCPGCATGSVVTSLNGLTGALSVANASAGGSTITLNDASTAQKGIAQFNSTNFSASAGVINTIQDIAIASTPTFGRLTVTSSQATNGMVLVNNTNAGATGNLLDLQTNSISQFSVGPAGALTLLGTVNGQTISSTANFTGTLGVSGLASLNGGATVTGTLTANTLTPTSSLTIGATTQSFLVQGNASSTITATNGANVTTMSFQAPTASVTYRLLTAAAGTYDICTTVGNCAGTGGGVTTVGGTNGAIARFSGSNSIVNSIITDNGSTVTIGGTLAVNTITPTAAMTIGATTQNLTLQGATTQLTATSGGVTNTLTFATPGTGNKTITLPNATGTVAVNASGPLALDAAGNLTCPTCLTSGGGGGGTAGVASVDGLTGALTIANSTGSSTTITINDASTAQKGIAQFNNTNFSTSAGTVNTIQDIAVSSAPTFGRLTVTSAQATNGMMLVNNTNAGAVGNLLDLQTNSISQLSVSPAGAMTLLGTVNGQTISSSTNFTGTLGVSGLASLNGGATVTGALTANTLTPTSSLTVGATTQSFLVQGNASSTISATSGANVTTMSFQTPTASVTYRLLTAAAGTYDICTTVGNCAGTGGGVTTVGGTSGAIARFSGSNSIVDSIITDNGSAVTIGGTLSVNTVTPTAAMTIGSTTQNLTLQGATTQLTATTGGITNTLTFAAPGSINKTITLPNATGTVAVSASGPLALDSSGNLTCPTCLTSGGGGGGTAGVASVDGLTGALTIANSTGSSTTITINDASTAQKGIAQFNNTNFSTSAGTVNTIQDIAVSSAPTFAALTLAGGLNPDITSTVSAGAGAALTFQPGTSTGASTNGAATTIKGGNGSGTTAVTGGALVLQGGSATGASGTRTGGNVTIDAGTGNVPSTNGTVTIGASALALTLGSSTNNTSTTLQSGSGGVSLTSTGSGSFSTSGSLSLTSGGAATWKTSSGNLTVQANGSSNLNLETSGAGTINLGQNNTTTVNIASNSNTVRTINIGNVSAGTQAQTISIGTAGAGTGSVTLAAGSVGVNLNANVNSPTNINTGGSTGTITLGGGSSNLVINSVNFDVTSGGTATAATSVLTPLLDAASAVALTIGGTNASSLTLGRAAAAFTLQGNASSTLTATSGGFTTTLGFTTPTANRAISLPDAGGTICTTVFATCSSVYGAASGSGSYIQNGTTTQTANFYVQSAASGNIGGIIQGAAGQTVDIFRVISSGGVINMAVKANGSTEFTPTADSASAFNVRGSAGDNMLTIDTVSSRIGLNLGGTNTPTMNGPGLQVRGGLQLSDAGNSGLLHNFTTPGSSTVPSRLSVNAESLSAGSSIISIGLTGTSNANSRAMLIYDGRANSQSLPGLAVVNPNETSTIGLTWRGSNSTGYFTSQPSAGTSTSNVTLQSGDITGGSGLTTGAVALTTGTGAGGSANISTGAIAIDPGAATGTGTAGAITIGGTNASSVAIGGSSTPINLQGTTTVTGTSSTALTVNTGANTNKGVVIQGGASQTSYLLEAYNNTDRVFSVDSYGQTLVRTQTGHNSYDALRVLRADGANILNVDTSSRVVGINNTQGNGASVVATLALNNTADRIGIQIAANGTQTADLLRAYDSSGNTALSITNTGNLLFGSTAAHTTSVAQSAAGAGNNLTISAGQGASGQLGGNLVLQAGANGTASGSPGSVVIRANGGDSATAFQIQTADGTGNLFTADTSNRVVKVALGSTASTNAVCSDLANSTAPTAGTAYELRDCSSAPAADYAENYPVASGVSYGAIVALGDKEVATYDTGANGQIDWTKIKGNVTQLVKSAQAYQSTTIGIVSDNHSDFTSAGYNIKAQDNPMPVALNGRVPVQVSDSSWPIQAGDYLTTSTDPGKAMKATDAGFVIGKALASWTPGTGTATVMVFVEPGYYPGSSITNLIQNGSNATLSSLTVSGSASITKLTVQKLIILADLTINGHIITGNNNGTTTVQADANSGSTGICTISGNDTSGQITITPTGTGIAEGAQCTITLSSSFTTAPHPVISPVETNAQSVGAYANATTNTITVGFTNPGKAAKSYTFNYFNVQ